MAALGRDDIFGLNLLARWDAGQVKITRDTLPEVNAMALAAESGVQLDPLPDGRWVLTHLAADGTVGRAYANDEVHFS